MDNEQENNENKVKTKRIKLKRGRRGHKPTEQSRKTVMNAVGMGLNKKSVARVMGIDPRTLRKLYATELETGVDLANLTVIKALYKMASSGNNVIAAIFWAKAMAGWQDTQKTVHEGLPEKISVTFALKAPDNGPIIEAPPVVDLIEQK